MTGRSPPAPHGARPLPASPLVLRRPRRRARRALRGRCGTRGISTSPGGSRSPAPRASTAPPRFDARSQARRYGDALALWRGAALLEWAEQPWARAIATRLEEERLVALESRLTLDIDAGFASLVIGELGALVEEHPLRERLRVLLVRALYAAGRQAEALQAYAQARRYLVDEVGLEPTLGHPPGHVAVHLASNGEQAVMCGDLRTSYLRSCVVSIKACSRRSAPQAKYLTTDR